MPLPGAETRTAVRYPLFHRPSLIRGPPNVPDAESLSFSSFLSQPKGKEGPPPLG